MVVELATALTLLPKFGDKLTSQIHRGGPCQICDAMMCTAKLQIVAKQIQGSASTKMSDCISLTPKCRSDWHPRVLLKSDSLSPMCVEVQLHLQGHQWDCAQNQHRNPACGTVCAICTRKILRNSCTESALVSTPPTARNWWHQSVTISIQWEKHTTFARRKQTKTLTRISGKQFTPPWPTTQIGPNASKWCSFISFWD